MKCITTGVLETISSRQDNSVKLTVGTQELGSEEIGRLFELKGKYCKFLLTDSNITPIDESLIDELKLKDGKKVKTKSQRMRAVLYRLHESEGGSKDTFNAFYDEKMERMIEQIKSRI